MKVECLSCPYLTVMMIRATGFIYMFYPALDGDMRTADKSKLERPGIQRNLPNLLSNEKV